MKRPASLQELAPRWARLCLEVEAELYRLSPDIRGASLLVACSGGIDSTALLHILAVLAPKNEFSINVVHLDHGLRPGSPEDLRFVHTLCEQLQLPFHSKQCNVGHLAETTEHSLETAGRMARYEYFETVRTLTNSQHLLLGHHQNDLMEDVVMRLMRGTGWPALGGMTAQDNERHLLRPLLYQTKVTLRSFLEGNDYSWREDDTNTNTGFTRNRIRHDVVPLLLKENARLGDAVTRLHSQAQIDADFYAEQIKRIPFTKTAQDITLQLEEISTLHPGIRTRAFKKFLDELGPGQVLFETLMDLENAVKRMPLPKICQFLFPGAKVVTLQGKTILFSKK